MVPGRGWQRREEAPSRSYALTMDSRAAATFRAIVTMWNGASTGQLPSLLAPTYRGHTLGVPDGERDAAAYPAAIGRFRAANAGTTFTVVELLVAGDRLVA